MEIICVLLLFISCLSLPKRRERKKHCKSLLTEVSDAGIYLMSIYHGTSAVLLEEHKLQEILKEKKGTSPSFSQSWISHSVSHCH